MFCPLSISACPFEQLGYCIPWCVPAQVLVTPALPRFPSEPLVMASLAPAVAACAHRRHPAQWLSHPIYLTQTRSSRPSPVYLSSAWFSLGVSNSPVPLHPGSHHEMRWRGWEWVSVFRDESCVSLSMRVHVFVKHFVRYHQSRKHGHHRQP